jgi:hypothetical protein
MIHVAMGSPLAEHMAAPTNAVIDTLISAAAGGPAGSVSVQGQAGRTDRDVGQVRRLDRSARHARLLSRNGWATSEFVARLPLPSQIQVP